MICPGPAKVIADPVQFVPASFEQLSFAAPAAEVAVNAQRLLQSLAAPVLRSSGARPPGCQGVGLALPVAEMPGRLSVGGVAGDGVGPGTADGSATSALLPGHREPTPILRLRYQESADRWAIGIYLASSGQYTESESPVSFGPRPAPPEQGSMTPSSSRRAPKTGRLWRSARTRDIIKTTKVRNTRV